MKQYFSFSGSASRSEYWGVMILTWVIAFFAGIFISALFALGSVMISIFGLLACLALLVSVPWVMFATGARRCNEAGISPWWTLATIIPYIGWVVAVVLGCIPPANSTK